MRGVVIKKAQVISDDDRRKIVSILNGEIGIRDIHILFMKKEQPTDYSKVFVYEESRDIWVKKPLGNHKHFYPEIMYVLKGKCHYWLKNKEGETME